MAKASDVDPILKLLDVKRHFKVGFNSRHQILDLVVEFLRANRLSTLVVKKGHLGIHRLLEIQEIANSCRGAGLFSFQSGKIDLLRARPRVVLRLIQQERIPPPANLITLSRVSNLTSSTLIKFSQT